MRRGLILTAKIGFTLALLWWAQTEFAADGLLSLYQDISPEFVAAAVAIQAALTVLLTARWWLAARALGTRLPTMAAWRLVWIGQFFNQTLPSSLGGDAYRIWALCTRYGASLGFASTSVVVDRLLALLAIPIIAMVGLWLVPEFTRRPDIAVILWPAVLAVAAVAIVLSRLDAVPAGWHRLAPRTFARAEWFSSALRGAARRRPIAIAGVSLSIVIHMCVALSVYMLTRAIGLDAKLLHILLVTPLVLVIAMVPITISGWGLREGAMVTAFGALGYDVSLVFATSVAYGLTMIVIGLPGGLLWILQGSGERSAREQPEQPDVKWSMAAARSSTRRSRM
ncbi:MAG: flippase-like domain-containing protein [Rhodospirillales bacterium]|nr:flippase-like domain-containing protein [Rhodospirillales bacterium]